ncbi:hypothetical protein Tco_1214829 [Tanacetum coccineum]
MHDKPYVTQTDLNKQLLPEVADPNVEDPNVLPEVLPEDREDVLPEVSDPNVVMEEVTGVIISLEITCDSAMEITCDSALKMWGWTNWECDRMGVDDIGGVRWRFAAVGCDNGGDLWVEEVISVKGVPWVGDGGVSSVSLSVVSSSDDKNGEVAGNGGIWSDDGYSDGSDSESDAVGGVITGVVSGIVVGMVPNKITHLAGVPTLPSDESEEIEISEILAINSGNKGYFLSDNIYTSKDSKFKQCTLQVNSSSSATLYARRDSQMYLLCSSFFNVRIQSSASTWLNSSC